MAPPRNDPAFEKVVETIDLLRSEIQALKIEAAVEKAVNRLKWGMVISISSGMGGIVAAVVVFFLKK